MKILVVPAGVLPDVARNALWHARIRITHVGKTSLGVTTWRFERNGAAVELAFDEAIEGRIPLNDRFSPTERALLHALQLRNIIEFE